MLDNTGGEYILHTMASQAEGFSRNRVVNYLDRTLKDASGVKLAREVAGDHHVVDIDKNMLIIDMKAVTAGASDLALPITSRAFRRVGEHYEGAYKDDNWWLGFPGSIIAEVAITAASYVYAKENGSGIRESVEIFSALKGAEIGIATVGKDIFNAIHSKTSKLFPIK